MKNHHLRIILLSVAVAILSACGGGGGSSGPAVRAALPRIVEDTVPAGERLDLRSRNYFPAATGDTWTYSFVQGGAGVGTVTRSVSSVSGNEFTIAEAGFGTTEYTNYRRSTEGLVQVDLMGDSVSAAARALIGEILEFAEPFYPVGGTRRSVRQGDWSSDEDGDGINESFRLELTQQLVGLETVSLPLGSAETAHFRTVMALTLSPSKPSETPYTISATEETWWAPGIGLIRADRSAVDALNTSVIAPYSLQITGGQVGGSTLFVAPPDGTLNKITLTHNALVFDAGRNRYYASIPGSVPGNGNRIATIDASSGAVSYSAAVGAEPFALAMTADGSALYVGLNGSGDVVKLSLPGMAEQWRTRLPNDAFYGQFQAEQIAANPTNPDVVAVSLIRPNLSPRHGGVALIDGGVLQPRITQPHTGSNLIAFDSAGQYVYGYNNESTEYGLRKIEVRVDGLVELFTVTTSGGYTPRSLDWSPQGIVLERTLYRASDLAQLGTVNTLASPAGCRAHSVPNRLVCFYTAPGNGGDGRLALVDASSFVIQATPAYLLSSNQEAPSQLVAGAAGQVALRFGATYWQSPATALWLFSSAMLQ